MDEKTAMLPAPAVSNCRCQSEYKKKRGFRRVALVLAALLAFHLFVRPIMTVTSNWYHGSPRMSCTERATIPWEGQTNYEVDPAKYAGLTVYQNGSTTDGYVKVFNQSDDDLAHINFDISFSDPHLQDAITIGAEEKDEGYRIIVDSPRHLHHECITIKITIALPKSREFSAFEVGTVNAKIEVLDDISTKDTIVLRTVNGSVFAEEQLKSESLEIETVNGPIFVKKIEAKNITFLTVNGSIKGDVKAETGKAKSVNGSITLDTDAEFIEAESVNGSIHLTASSQGVGIQTKTVHGSTHINVSKHFEGSFNLKTMMGKTEVTAKSNPDKLHFDKKGYRETEGFYGNREGQSFIESESTVGTIHLEIE